MLWMQILPSRYQMVTWIEQGVAWCANVSSCSLGGPGTTYQDQSEEIDAVIHEGHHRRFIRSNAHSWCRDDDLFPIISSSYVSPVINFLCTLLVPSTHPSHPATQVILTTLKEAQWGYTEIWGNWSVKFLEGRESSLWLMQKPWIRLWQERSLGSGLSWFWAVHWSHFHSAFLP